MAVAFIFFGFLAIGMPIAFAIGLAGLTGLIQLDNPRFMVTGVSKLFTGMDSFTFLAMPFFILAGEIMNHIGITRQLMRLAHVMVGHFRGGLAHANMVASVLFSGLTGAATADAAAFGKTLVPEMVRNGYRRDYAAAVTAAGSIIGPTIPPSGLMVVYGSLMGVSIGGLFAAGILPGLLICGVCMAIIALGAIHNDLPRAEPRVTLKVLLLSIRDAALALIMPVIILGGILGGVVTPTEAASVAVAYALFVGAVIYRNMSLRALYTMLLATARTTGIIFAIIAFASLLGWWMSFERIPQAIADMVLSVSDNRVVVIFLMVLILLVIGMVMDITAILIILAPVLVPLANEVGLEPIHSGIIFVLALNISLMTPPVGACLFVLSSVTGEKLERIAAKLWPFLIAEIAILFVFAYWEGLALFVPRLLGFAN